MAMEEASRWVKQQQMDQDNKWNKTKGLQLHAKQQIQTSSVYDHDVEESWIEANLFVVLTMSLNTSRGKAVASNISARELVELKEVMLSEKAQICVEVACTIVCTNLVLVLVKIKINNMKHMGMEDYTLCDNRAQAKPSTAMEVVGMMYTTIEMWMEASEKKD